MKKLLILFVLAGMSAAHAASGDAHNPTECSAGADWSNCDSTYTSNNLRATNNGTNDHSLADTTFGFSVPVGATVDSFYFIIEGYGTSALSPRRHIQIQPIINGSATGDVVDMTLNQSSDLIDTARGTTNDLWNLTPTVSDMNDAGTGVTITKHSGKSDAIYLDHVQMVIWWTEASTAKGQVIKIRTM